MSVLTESEEDEDLHQCGRCRAMFRRLAEYIAHKQQHKKTCNRCVDSEAQTSPTHHSTDAEAGVDWQVSTGDRETETADLANVVRQSLQASLGEDDRLGDDGSLLPSSVCNEQDSAAALHPGSDNDVVALPSVTYDVSRSSSADDASVADSDDRLVQSDDDNDVRTVVAAADGMPQAPPPHQCPQCDFTAKFRDDFDQHLRRQHGLSCHVCVDCSRAFTDAYKLRRHQRVYCTKTPVRKKQNALLSGHEQKQHQLVPRFLALDKRKKPQDEDGANDAPFRCRMCPETFVDYDGVQGHVVAVHSAMARPGICRFCGAWFANPYKLRRHVSTSVHDDLPTEVVMAFKRQIDRMSISCTPEALRLLRRARAERRQQHLAALGSGNECLACRQTFSTRSTLLRHRKVVHGRRSATDAAPTISCQLCGASFDRRRAYLRHRRDEHRKLPVVRAPPATRKCSVCDRLFTRASAAARHHAVVHSARQQVPDSVLSQSISFDVDDQVFPGAELDSSAAFTCFVCAQLSASRADLARHLELFHRVWVPRADGPVPPALFDDVPAIPPSLKHIDDALAATQTQRFATSASSATHSDESQEQIVPDTSSRSKCRGSVSSRWSCPYCAHAAFKTLDALYRHKVDDHRLEAAFRCVVTACRVTYRVLADYEAHVTSCGHSQAAFICSVCNEHFVDLLALRSHRGSVHRSQCRPAHHPAVLGASPLTSSKQAGSILCDQCGQTFSRRKCLMYHRAVVHKRDSCLRYACSQCDRRFVKREHLQRHVVSRHATARPYVCRAAGCGRAFKRKDKLQDHYRCHSTDRQYACSLCGRTYRQRDGLRLHERTHRRLSPSETDNPERRHGCSRCPATFTRAGKLAEHLRTVHGRGAGKDIYAHRCDVCGKTFPRPERVRRHAERAHNIPADWSHRCTVCGQGFAGRRSYELHVARHHVDGGTTTAKRCRRRTKAKTTPNKKTTTSSPRVVVVTGRHQSSVTASCDVTRLTAGAERQTDVPSTSHCFNRFFVPSTLSGHQPQQFEQASSSAELRLSSHVDASLNRLHCADRGLSQCHDTATDFGAHRRLSFEPLPYLHHPTRTNNDYSYYTSGYHQHPAAPHTTRFGFYPSTPAGFGYTSNSAAACAAAPRGCGLFAADRTAAALPFGVQAAEPCLAGQSVERRPTEFSSSLATAFPSVMTGDYGGASGATAPLRPLATQPPANTYCPVPDAPTVGRWFDSVPTLLPPAVDASNLDAVRWPPRPCIDSLAVRPRYPFGVEPTSRCYNQQSTMSRSVTDTASSVAGPSWSSVERSCLLNCSRMDSAGAAGLMLGPRRRGVDGDRGVDTTGGHRDTGASVPPHGMLPLLPPW